jgi:transposase InsO family protein
MNATVELRVGTRLRWREDDYRVVGLESGALRLRARSGEPLLVDPGTLFDDPTFVLAEVEDGERAGRAGDLLDALPAGARQEVEERIASLFEAETGYRSGLSEVAEPGEPRPSYDPDLTTKTERFAAKAAELGVGVSTLHRWDAALKDEGPLGLADKRLLRPVAEEPQVDERISEILNDVLADLSSRSTRKKHAIRTDLVLRIRHHYGKEVAIPSESTLNRLIEARDRHFRVQVPASKRDQRHRAPKVPYGQKVADRPGQLVLIDSTVLPILALDRITMEPFRPVYTAALDLCSRTANGRRTTHGAPTSVDVSLLIYDMLRPRAFKAHWPAGGRWRYAGVPETIVAELRSDWGMEELAGVPVIRPDALVADGAWINRSRPVLATLRRLGIGLDIARPYMPTDKSQLERWFPNLERVLQPLPGYVGPDAISRGHDVEAEASLFDDEVEEIVDQAICCDYHRRPHRGLALPGRPNIFISPNEAYDEGIARAGFIRVPSDPGIYFELLPTEWRPVHRYGIEIGKVRYDSPELDPLRLRRSRFGGSANGQWPFRVDPRDLSRIYFYDAELRRWFTVPWRSEHAEERPFGEFTVELARRIARARGSRDDVHDTARAIIEVLETAPACHAASRGRERQRLRREIAAAQQSRRETPARHAAAAEPADRITPVPDDEAPEIEIAIESWSTVE